MIELRTVSKEYAPGGQPVTALDGVSLTIERGELTCVIGPSGAGKSTMLHLLGCLDLPTRGEILFDGRPVSSLSDDELSVMRRDRIGFVFQFFNLIATLTAEENIALPCLIAGQRIEEVRGKVEKLLRLVDLSNRRQHKPDQLSGGELQRVAIARALINDPLVVLADEPTGNLDSANGDAIISLLKEISQGGSNSVVVATHSSDLAQVGDCVVTLRDGRVESVARKSRPKALSV